MSFSSLSSELVGRLPGLSPFLADTFCSRAWREIRDERLWSFLQDDCGVVCPTQVVAGTVNITQFSATVVCDATASAALLAITLPSPLDLTAMQIRFGGTGDAAQTGQIYSITDFDDTDPAALELTLDRVVVQTTNAVSGYQCFRCYIKPVVEDFLAWQSLVDMTNGWSLRLDYTSTAFDRRDPQRQAQGLAYYCGAFKGNPGTQPRPQYELWPVPTSGQTFYGRFRRQGADFFDATDTQSPIIPDSLIIERALGYHAYPWAAQNVGAFPAFQKNNWPSLMLQSKQAYQQDLLRAKKQDDEQELQTVWARGHGLVHGTPGFKGMTNYPIDAAFLQSHLVNI